MALIQTRYFKSIFRKNSVIFILNKNLFLNGRCFRPFLKFFKRTYQIYVLDYSMDIILARIFWVQIHEPCRGSHICVYT